MVERKDPSTIAIQGGSEKDVRRFLSHDQLIRSGMCPNGCGLMTEADGLQECPKCRFMTNVRAEKGLPS